MYAHLLNNLNFINQIWLYIYKLNSLTNFTNFAFKRKTSIVFILPWWHLHINIAEYCF